MAKRPGHPAASTSSASARRRRRRRRRRRTGWKFRVTKAEIVDVDPGYRSAEATAKALRRITAGCRPDMHEPDEQEVSAKVTGRVLDNAGVGPELTVVITNKALGIRDKFNLADLIALARMVGL